MDSMIKQNNESISWAILYKIVKKKHEYDSWTMHTINKVKQSGKPLMRTIICNIVKQNRELIIWSIANNAVKSNHEPILWVVLDNIVKLYYGHILLFLLYKILN